MAVEELYFLGRAFNRNDFH